MYFDCRYKYFPEPFEPGQFIRHMIVDVVCRAPDDRDVVAARLAVDHLELSRPFNGGEGIAEICDVDSSEWEAVFSTLFEPNSDAEWRSDFGIDDVVNNVVFLREAVFHPTLRNWQSFIIDRLIDMFGDATVFTMRKHETDLTDSELAELGFRIIAGSEFLVRLNMYNSEFSKSAKQRSVLDLEVPADARKYVDERWSNPFDF